MKHVGEMMISGFIVWVITCVVIGHARTKNWGKVENVLDKRK